MLRAERRTFLVGLGRFMMGAAATAIIKPPVLYSFPSAICIVSPEEQEWVSARVHLVENMGAQRIGTAMAYIMNFEWRRK